MISFLMALLAPAPSLADISEEAARKQVNVVTAAADRARGELPPCEGHEHLESVVSQFTPPASCPKAGEYFEHHMQLSRSIRGNCRETARWMEDLLRQPDYCAAGATKRAAHKKLNLFKHEISPEDESEIAGAILANEEGLRYYLDSANEPRPKTGEWSRLECAQGVRMAMQFRTRQRSLAKSHFAHADQALDSVCARGPEGADAYLHLLRYGEDGL